VCDARLERNGDRARGAALVGHQSVALCNQGSIYPCLHPLFSTLLPFNIFCLYCLRFSTAIPQSWPPCYCHLDSSIVGFSLSVLLNAQFRALTCPLFQTPMRAAVRQRCMKRYNGSTESMRGLVCIRTFGLQNSLGPNRCWITTGRFIRSVV
jgi:hypothetical protein